MEIGGELGGFRPLDDIAVRWLRTTFQPIPDQTWYTDEPIGTKIPGLKYKYQEQTVSTKIHIKWPIWKLFLSYD